MNPTLGCYTPDSHFLTQMSLSDSAQGKNRTTLTIMGFNGHIEMRNIMIEFDIPQGLLTVMHKVVDKVMHKVMHKAEENFGI